MLKGLVSRVLLAISLFGFGAAASEAKLKKTELQWSICEPSMAAFQSKLGWTRGDESTYMVAYFDSPDLRFHAAGISARVTHKANSASEKLKSKIKIEFQDPDDIDWEWLKGRDHKCEYDQYGFRMVPRCAVNNEPKTAGTLWSRDQVAFLRIYRPGFELQQLQQWGPYLGHELKFDSPKGEASLDATEILIGGKQVAIIEAAVRSSVEDAANTYQRYTWFFQQRGISLCSEQKGMFERLLQVPLN